VRKTAPLGAGLAVAAAVAHLCAFPGDEEEAKLLATESFDAGTDDNSVDDVETVESARNKVLRLSPVERILDHVMLSFNNRLPLREGDNLVSVRALGVGSMPAEGALAELMPAYPSEKLHDWVTKVRGTPDQGVGGSVNTTERATVLEKAAGSLPVKSDADKAWAREWLVTQRPLLSPFQVGSGDCMFIALPVSGNKTQSLLVDGGYVRHAATWWSAVAGVDGVDTLIITHCDQDHVAGVLEMARSTTAHFKRMVRQLMVTALDIPASRGNYQWIKAILGVDMLKKVSFSPKRGQLVSLKSGAKNVELWVVNPSRRGIGVFLEELAKDDADPNPMSIALLILWVPPGKTPATAKSADIVSLLLTGDAHLHDVIEGVREVANQNAHVANAVIVSGTVDAGQIHVSVLDMPHHGSTKSSQETDFEEISADHYIFQASGGRYSTMYGQRFLTLWEKRQTSHFWMTFAAFKLPSSPSAVEVARHKKVSAIFDSHVNREGQEEGVIHVLSKEDACHLLYVQ
jgi:hypothetical protein